MIIPFTGNTTRALVVIPGSDERRDYCRVILGGWPTDYDPLIEPGPLWRVKAAARDWGNGLPIAVHPECERRAGQ